VKARRAAPQTKKRHVKPVTRLPTKNVWQLLRWTFIVATSTPPEAAPILGFSSLQHTNSKTYQQLIYKRLWVACGRFSIARLGTGWRCNKARIPQILLD
jgi:hypothetical protein